MWKCVRPLPPDFRTLKIFMNEQDRNNFYFTTNPLHPAIAVLVRSYSERVL